MTSTTHRPESIAAALYVAVELSAKEWLLTMSTGPDGRRQRARLPPGDRGAFERATGMAKRRFGLSSEAAVRSCYEAGRDGFWPHRFLTAVRLRQAERLLAAGMAVTDACFEVGFGSLSHFIRLYKRRFGVVPSAARRGAVARSPLAAALWDAAG